MYIKFTYTGMSDIAYNNSTNNQFIIKYNTQ